MKNVKGILGFVFALIAVAIVVINNIYFGFFFNRSIINMYLFVVIIGIIVGILAILFSIVGIATGDSKTPCIIGLIWAIFAIFLSIYIVMSFGTIVL